MPTGRQDFWFSLIAPFDNTPVQAEVGHGITSGWAYDHYTSTDIHHKFLTVDGTRAIYLQKHYASFAVAIAAIGATNALLIVDYTEALTTNVTVPENIVCMIMKGALLSPAVNKTLTFYSPAHIIAQPNQRIKGGSGTLVFTTGGNVFPEWVGAGSNVAVDSGAAIREIVNAIPNGNVLLSTIYLVDSGGTNGGIDLKKGVYLKGHDNRTTGLIAGVNHPAKPLIYMMGLSGAVSTIGIENMSLVSSNGSSVTDAIYADGVASSRFDDLYINEFVNGAGIHLLFAGAAASGYFNRIINPYLRDNKYGIQLEGDTIKPDAPNCTTIIGGEIVGIANAVNAIRLTNKVTGTYLFGTDMENAFSDAILYVNGCQNNFFLPRLEHTVGTKVSNFINAVNNYLLVNTQGNYTYTSADLAAGSHYPSLFATTVTTNLSGAIAHDLSTAADIGDYRQQTERIINVYDMTADGYIQLPSPGVYPPGTKIRINRYESAVADQAYYLTIKAYLGTYWIYSEDGADHFVTLLSNCAGMLIGNHSVGWLWYPDKQRLAAAPVKGFWKSGAQVWNAAPAAAGVPGWICVFRLDTTLSVGEPSGETNMAVVSGAGTVNGDIIGVTQDNGIIHWSSITAGGGTTSLTMAAGLTDNAAAGKIVYVYRFKSMAALAA